MRIPILVACWLLSVVTVWAADNAADKNKAYVTKYKNVAVMQMYKYKIPASITLAQGILESGAGQSSLTRRSNNHFGIKCHRGWTGPYVLANDDKPNEKFRKYAHAADSYEDHSKFLVNNARYRSLFDLELTDYQGWAYGLKKAGYATSPTYAMALINIIERYGLYEYDQIKPQSDGKKKPTVKPDVPAERQALKTPTGLRYVLARQGDSLDAIAKEYGIKPSKLYAFNDAFSGFKLNKGDIVYLQKKHKKYKGEYGSHIVSAGESLHEISQIHGIRLESLYKLNKLDNEYTPSPGDTLKLCR